MVLKWSRQDLRPNKHHCYIILGIFPLVGILQVQGQHLAASVLTSHVFGPAKLIFDAGGVCRQNSMFGPIHSQSGPIHSPNYIYIYISSIILLPPPPPMYTSFWCCALLPQICVSAKMLSWICLTYIVFALSRSPLFRRSPFGDPPW
jgi:hypothetical protein